MAEYIDREAAVTALLGDETVHIPTLLFAQKRIEAIPAADVVEVRHGRWLSKDPAPFWSWYATCSVCGERQTLDRRYTDYCPNCGAKMMEVDGE